METSVFMLAVRCRSSRRKAAWNCQPTQNCTGVVSAKSTQCSRSTAGAQGKTSCMLPRRTGTESPAPTRNLRRRRRASARRSARSRSSGSGGAGAVARFPAARPTPGTPRRAPSTLPTQAAQCMPFTGKSTRVAVSDMERPSPLPAAEAGEDVEQLVHLLLPVPRVAGADGLRDAGRDMVPQHELLRLLDGALHRRELEGYVHAVLFLLQHALNALDLALDPAQPPQGLGLRVRVDHRPRLHVGSWNIPYGGTLSHC